MDINGQSLEATASPEITKIMAEHAMGTNQTVADSYGSGGAGRGLLGSPDRFNDNLGMGNQAQTDAIRSRYMPQFTRQEKQINLDNLKNASADRIRNLQVATQAAGDEVQVNKQKAILKDKIEKANRAARGQMLGTVLGIVGGVVGGVVGGAGTLGVGAGIGAGAGYAAGQGIGNAIGGS